MSSNASYALPLRFIQVISLAVDWVLQHQLPHGAFYEVTWLPSRNDNSTIHVPSSEPVAAQLLADPNNPAVLVSAGAVRGHVAALGDDNSTIHFL